MIETDQQALARLVGEDGVSDPRVDGVFEGGGVKAIAQVGALAAAEEVGLGWNLLAGTSGGAIVAALLAAHRRDGWRYIWDVLSQLDLSSVLDVAYLPNLRFLRRRYYFLLPLLPNLMRRGLFEGRELQAILRRHLSVAQADGSQRDLTFADFKIERKESWQSAYRLKCVATDISRRRPVVFPDDASDYAEFPDAAAMPVQLAVRASMSIPLLFKPVVLHDRMTGRPCLLVDGGVSSNYPIWIYDRPAYAGPPRRPTFGFLLDEGSSYFRIRGPLGLFWNTFHTAMGAMDSRLSPWDEERTVRIPIRGVRSTQFTLSRKQQDELFETGYRTAMAFFQRFNWPEHVRKYRSPGAEL